MNTFDLGYKFPEEEEKIINKYLIPETEYYISECEFHLEDKKEEKNYLTSSIPGCLDLKDQNNISPHLLFFYYNKDIEIFKIVYDLFQKISNDGSGVSFNNFYGDGGTNIDFSISGEEAKNIPINFKMVNLDLEKNLYKTFQNLKLTNPFNWMKIKDNKKEPFTIFYFNGFPQEFYKEEITYTKIKDRYMKNNDVNWNERYGNLNSLEYERYYQKIRKDKTRIIDDMELKDNYFLALENDKPVMGIKKDKYYKIITLSNREYKFIEV